ncbi:hydrogenase nickel incorporation protein HypB [Kyrpidia spormannii]|uniref:Hydrogenase maturation factor, HypB n=2 Tax=Kyrpidia spormannii TaxID=2055160 RepID=A0ACA8Z8F4_9BACL|nr:Hydrogenase maturation factor, HypB [Kyrpidia spormannii]CAB3392487.1 Hydrogenase accessory protein HypB [Kyrpidia spormannii]
MKVDVNRSVLEANNEIAERLRDTWRSRGIFVLNLISSPGSGKTTLLEKTLEGLKGRIKAAVLVGDVQTDNDARRLAGHGAEVKQIVTGGTCHLEAHMIEKHLEAVDGEDLELLIIENVGNLVCPTSYDLGEDGKVVLVSVTEGEDKPLKYPAIFHKARLALITKTDLAPHLDCDLEELRRNITAVNGQIEVLEVSARTGQGMEGWLEWILTRAAEKRGVAPRESEEGARA